jgi:DNA-binding response OmpR family regulator
MYSVLLVEDDLQLAKIVKRILESKDFIVTLVDDGTKALDYIKKGDYDFYLIDINIPGVNGLELVKHIRELKKRGKIIMITASVEEYNFKKAYEYGCDDYIKKPFHATELEVRIKHLLEQEEKNITFDDYEFIFDSKDLFKNGEMINLRKKEKKLLYILLKNANYTVDNQKIIEYVWEGENKENPPIRQLVNELRKKFDKDYIKTVVGVGYRFEI